MANQSVQVRPKTADVAEKIETYIENLIGKTVATTGSTVPVFIVQTTEENVQKMEEHFKEKYADQVTITGK